MFIKNKYAVIGFPVFLVVAIIIGAIIFSIFTIAIINIHKESQKNLVRTELEKITSEAENMFEYANNGSLVTINIDLPSSLKFVVFGSNPKNGLSKPVDLTLDDDVSNCYYFVMDDGTIKTYKSNARFCGKSFDEIKILYPGSYNLKLELLQHGGKTFVKIYK